VCDAAAERDLPRAWLGSSAYRHRGGSWRVHPRLPTLREGTSSTGARDRDKDLWKAVCGHHPNSYTFSKALSEFLLVRGHRSLWHLSHSGFNTGAVKPGVLFPV
jgi:hypothetical protein